MQIPEKIRRCVAFVALQMADKSYSLLGTVFFVVTDNKPNGYSYAVTAKHVINGIKNKGQNKVFIRVNLKNNTLDWVSTNLSDWIFHDDPNVDIAVFPIGLEDNFDHLLYPMSGILTQKVSQENEMGLGDEVFVTGLFRQHHGQQKNIPIVRVGNISAMPEEKIQTKEFLMEAYLIEARSIGGLSGSPVFVNFGIVRNLRGEFKQSKGRGIYFLMGLIHGHYDVKATNVDSDPSIDVGEYEKVNTGIAIVTPIEKLNEIFEQQKIKEHEARVDKLLSEMNKVVPPSLTTSPPSNTL